VANATENYNNITNTSVVTFEWYTKDGTIITGCINIYTVTDYGAERLQTLNCVNSSSDTFILASVLNTSQDINIKAEFEIDGIYYTYDNFRHASIFNLSELLLYFGFSIFILLLLYGLSLWFGFFILENIYITIILIILSGFVGYRLAPIFISLSFVTGAAIIGCITLWGVYKRR